MQNTKDNQKLEKDGLVPEDWMPAAVVWILLAGVLFAMLVCGLTACSKGHDDDADDARAEAVRQIVNRAGELDPFFFGTQDAYASDVEILGINSLERFAGYWGVVLDDGTVVLNKTTGEFVYDEEGLPVMAQRRIADYDAWIVMGLDLPEQWQNRTVTIIPHQSRSELHYVGVVTASASMNDGAVAYHTDLWVWTGTCYEQIEPVDASDQVALAVRLDE